METAPKSYPENYPSDALAILDAMSFSDGKAVKILGSMSIRSQQYAGDYDAFEVVKKSGDKATVLKQLAQQFKEIVKRLGRMPNVAIGDIKAGTIEEWRVIPKSAGVVNGKVVGYSAESAKSKIDFLRRKGVISKQEEEYANKHLKPTLTAEDFLKVRKELRFNLIRWTVPEVLAGQKRLRDGSTYTLEEAFDSPTITKLDTIGFVQNNKYTDFSMIYEFECNGEVLNPDDIAIERSLKEDILYYRDEGMPFKALKRVFALAKFKDDNALIKKLVPILNSDLGRLYSLSTDLETLVKLLETEKVDMNKVRFELDQMKSRIGNVFQIPHFGNTEHSFVGHINSALKASEEQLPQHLIALQKLVNAELRKNTTTTYGKSRVI